MFLRTPVIFQFHHSDSFKKLFPHNSTLYYLIGSQECDFSTNRTAIRAEIALMWINHIRVLTSANQSYLIIGFKQPIKFNKNVLWQMNTKTKNLHMSWMI
jgi:hypothetical protein